MSSLDRLLAPGAEIFHYAGHGEYAGDIEQGILLLEDQERLRIDYPADSLASLLSAAGVRLAVLGACDSGRRSGKNPWGGIAPVLAQAGIPAVIASQFKIETTNAERLVETVFPRIMSGFSVDEAVSAARGVLFRANQQGEEPQSGLKQRDWAALVLYLSAEDGVLFDPPAKSAASEQVMQKMRTIVIKVGNVTDAIVIGERGKPTNANINITTGDLNGGTVIGGDHVSDQTPNPPRPKRRR
jgi:hypothetical protein